MTSSGTNELDALKKAHDALAPLDSEQRARSLKWLVDALGVEVSLTPATPLGGVPAGAGTAAHAPGAPVGGAGGLTPKQFMAEKKPSNAVERLACLAYYLTHHRGVASFKTKDLTALNTEAAQPKFANAPRDADNAERSSGYLVSAGGGARQLTTRGEKVVEALPDRDAVKAASSEHPHKKRATSPGRRAVKKAAAKVSKKV